MASDFDDDPIRMAHDSLVKRSFGIVENARGELQAVLPPDLVREIDWSTLELVAQPTVGTRLRSREIDLLYRVKIHEHPALLYTVFEAQRSVECSAWVRIIVVPNHSPPSVENT